MNERIRELALRAGFQYIKDEGIGWAGNYNSSLPKFAELIVKECILELGISKKCDPYTGELFVCEHNAVLDEQIDMLKEIFGVEE